MACQFCDRIPTLGSNARLTSVSKRLGGHLLDGLLLFVTLGIGWAIWALLLSNRGQTPAKQMLGMHVIDLRTNRPATFGRMFVREIIGGFVAYIASIITFSITVFMLLWDKNRQMVWDKVAGTIVVDNYR